MKTLRYELLPEDDTTQLGLIVLQSDVTIEDEFRYYFEDQSVSLLANRIPFENEVTPETLKQMALHVGNTTALFPITSKFDAVGYACTSGALHIGSDRIQALVQEHRECPHVTNPMKAAITALRHIDAKNIAFLAPYSQHVSQTMIDKIQQSGITISHSATYDESQDALVGRITPQSIRQAATDLCREAAAEDIKIDAIFIACTNMKCARVIPEIEEETGIYALSSNLVLAWDMARLAGNPLQSTTKGKLCQPTH